MDKLRALLIRCGLGGIANTIWQLIYPYTPLKHKRDIALRRLFSEFIHPGYCVFDIGANRGLYTELFHNMGAKTLSVEPNEKLAKKIPRYSDSYVQWTAVGSHFHWTDFWLGEINGLSTLSYEYMKRDRNIGNKWKKQKKVLVYTVDMLSRLYGVPDFIKIDVEGWESEVLSGMSFAPKALTFEFIPEDIVGLQKCCDRLDSLGNYEYTYTVNLTPDMHFECGWDVASNIIRHIVKRVKLNEFGDIWGRRIL